MINGFLVCYFGFNVILTGLIVYKEITTYKSIKEFRLKLDLQFFIKKLFTYLTLGMFWILIYFWEEILN